MPTLRNALSGGLAGGGGIESLMEQLRRQLGGGGGAGGTAPGGQPSPPPGPDPGGSGPFFPGGGSPPFNPNPTAPQTKPKAAPQTKPPMNAPPFNPSAPKPGTSLDEQQADSKGQKPGGGSGPFYPRDSTTTTTKPPGGGQQLPPGAGDPRPTGPGQTLPGGGGDKPNVVNGIHLRPGVTYDQWKAARPNERAALVVAGGGSSREGWVPGSSIRLNQSAGAPPNAAGAPAPSLPPPGAGAQPFVSEGFGRPGEPIQLPGGGTLTIPPEGLTQPEYDVLSGVRAGNPIGGPFAQRIYDDLMRRGVIAAPAGGAPRSMSPREPLQRPPGLGGIAAPGGAPQVPGNNPGVTAPGGPPTLSGGPYAPGTGPSYPPGGLGGPPTLTEYPYSPGGAAPSYPPGGGFADPNSVPGGAAADIRTAMPDWMQRIPGVTNEVALQWAKNNPTVPGAAEILRLHPGQGQQVGNSLSLIRGAA